MCLKYIVCIRYHLYMSHSLCTCLSLPLFILVTFGGSTHSFTPVQEVSGQLHETSHSQLPASDPPSCEMVTDGVNNIQMKDPIESTDTGKFIET